MAKKKTTATRTRSRAKQQTELILAKSQAEVARFLGVSKKTVSLWSDRWPFGKKPPYNLHLVSAWARRDAAENPKSKHQIQINGNSETGQEVHRVSALQEASVEYKRAQTGKLHRANRLFDQEFVEREQVKAEIAGIIAAARAVAMAEPAAAAEALVDKGVIKGRGNRTKARQILEARARGWLNKLADDLDELVEREIEKQTGATS